MYLGKKIAVVIPALNEEDTIGMVIRDLPVFVDRVVLGDNGSTDQTVSQANKSGAEIVITESRGYGSACKAALTFLADNPPDIVAFLDADGSDNPKFLEKLIDPVANDRCDLCLASRTLAGAEQGALSLAQRIGNRLVTWLIGLVFARQFSDLGPYRAISWQALSRLDMSDPDFAWTVEMQVKAIRLGLRVNEVPIYYRRRQGGRSKISGSLKSSLQAGGKMVFWIIKESTQKRSSCKF